MASRALLGKPLAKIHALLIEKGDPDNVNRKKWEWEIGKELREEPWFKTSK